MTGVQTCALPILESVEYMSDFHNYKLKIRYLENGKSKDVVVSMQDKDSIIRDYFKDNGTSISESMFSLIINIYKFVFLTLFIILVIKIIIYLNNKGSK